VDAKYGDEVMTIHIDLSPDMEHFIEAKVAGGLYGNAAEVVQDAIRRMQAEDVRLAAWRAAIKVGDDQLDRGEGIDYTPDLLNEMTQRAIDDMHSDRQMDADALP
jgi:antitoxin ParD1/3/4